MPENHQEFVNDNMLKVMGYQLEYGNFRKHLFMLNSEDYHQKFQLEMTERPFYYSYLNKISFENDLLIYLASLIAYRDQTLPPLRDYLMSTKNQILEGLKD